MHVIRPDEAVQLISTWARQRQSKAVGICNAHSLVTARQDSRHEASLLAADLRTPDGAPVAWMMRKLGAPTQGRVSGPDLMLDYCAHAAATGESIFLLGSTPDTLDKLQTRLRTIWPTLRIAGAISPPFRALSDEEDQALTQAINDSGAGTVWVSLGCPKQERWMTEHQGKVQAVMVGVGAAFDFHAGTIQRAPAWMRNNGLEWLHRLGSEPGRLWKRYLVTNSLFVYLALLDLRRSLTHRNV
ncbi:WecB/TagA/CpsF family glycosyltransferase [Sphaerotilus mobilis]|nr:WecB/TagA/CpsF family glycosyltransferase [Sphaerotilus mobilis]